MASQRGWLLSRNLKELRVYPENTCKRSTWGRSNCKGGYGCSVILVSPSKKRAWHLAGVSNLQLRMAMNAAQHRIVNLLKIFLCSSVFISVCVFNVWPKKTLLLPEWPRDNKSLDTPERMLRAHLWKKSRNSYLTRLLWGLNRIITTWVCVAYQTTCWMTGDGFDLGSATFLNEQIAAEHPLWGSLVSLPHHYVI